MCVISRPTRTGVDRGSFNVRVIDGHRAQIHLGQLVPRRQGSVGPYGILFGTVYQDVRSGIDVIPRIIGDQVRVEIHPQVRRISSSDRRRIDITEANTVLTTRPGVWTTLGEIGQSEQNAEQGIIYRRTRSGDRPRRD